MAPTTIWGLIVFCVMIWGFVCKFRASITPGTVLIRLAGRFKGKVVVFLKQLASGLLWVTGLFKISGVSIRRVNQANLIATFTKVDISRIIADKCGTLELEEEKKNVLPQEKKGEQKAMDAALLKSIEAVPDLEELKNQIDSVMVVAAIIMTVAFKTGLIIAGRYMRDGLLEILSSCASYEAFTISIILAFLLSCYAVLNLFCTKHLLHRREDIIDQLNVAKFCTLSAIFAMIVAFGSSVVLAIAITDH